MSFENTDLLDLAVGEEIVAKNGAYYAYGKATIGHGREKARRALLADAKLREDIERALFARKRVTPQSKAA